MRIPKANKSVQARADGITGTDLEAARRFAAFGSQARMPLLRMGLRQWMTRVPQFRQKFD